MTQPRKRTIPSQRLSDISPRYVEDKELQDTSASLFRQLLNAMKMTPMYWGKLVRDYLQYSITTKDREKAKKERIHQNGNIKDTYFHKPTLTFNKLLAGLSILQIVECEVILRVKDKDGKVYEVSEKRLVRGPANSSPSPEGKAEKSEFE